ncbi:MAG TPA: hypothetical protein VHG35_06490 [Gemmatimonadales bacterium]|nr:hypothetical protein [Gemmatimonadales bacterium]
MGAWGGGLYHSDFALDLKATIRCVLRAPLGDDDLLPEIEASVGEGVEGADSLDYWLVLADQLERCGVPRRDVFERAIAIVETGEDVALLEESGADPRTIAERRRETGSLVERLRDPRPAKPRRVLKKPQPLLLEPGEALAWPTDRGASVNPYVSEDQLWKLGGFTQDGWGFGIVTDAGHHFHVLAFYAVQVLKWRRAERPSPDLAVHCPRAPHHYGTMGEVHLKRARVERLGRVPEAAMSPPPDPDHAERMSRRAVLGDVGLSGAFGYDAWNHWVLPGPKFVFPPPSGQPLDPDEPDQRPGPHDRS